MVGTTKRSRAYFVFVHDEFVFVFVFVFVLLLVLVLVLVPLGKLFGSIAILATKANKSGSIDAARSYSNVAAASHIAKTRTATRERKIGKEARRVETKVGD